jgi:hypothetical protein
MQHAHFCCKQILASSCLQIEHIQACAVILSIFFFSLDFTSTYNHNATSGKPIEKNTMIVRIGMRKTNNEMPKHTVPIPRAKSQRVVIFILRLIIYMSLFFNNFYTRTRIFLQLFYFLKYFSLQVKKSRMILS